MELKFTIPAVPIAQPRARAGRGVNGHARIYNDKKHPVNDFKATIRLAVQTLYKGPPLAGPLVVDCLFVFPRETSKIWKSKPMPRYPHTVKPDRDNLDKAVLDSLKGTLLKDDAIVYDGRITKMRAAGDEQPHCVITITSEEESPF